MKQLFSLLLITFGILFSVSIDLSAAPKESVEPARQIALRSGEKIKGKIVFESEEHYRVELGDGSQKVIFKRDVSYISPLKASPPISKSAATSETDDGSFLDRWQRMIDKASPEKKYFALDTTQVLLGIWIWFAFMSLSAFFLKIFVKLVGGTIAFWKAFFFQFKAWFLFTLFLIIMALVLAFIVFLLHPTGTGAEGLRYGFPLLCVLIMINSYLSMLQKDLDLNTWQGLGLIILQVGLIVLLFTGIKLFA